ncbi:MAG TPA: hypothetical protein HPQ04_15465 [Rhodospirillaceae bacterium]|nr:hypothetical protein [Rhodospirillaceae bacterium]
MAGETFYVNVTIKVPNVTSTNLTYLKSIVDRADPEPSDNSVSFAIVTDSSSGGGGNRAGGGSGGSDGTGGPSSGGVREAVVVMGANVLLALSVIGATAAFF